MKPHASETSQTLMPDLDPEARRLDSLDAYRGFVMLAMASSGLGIVQVARSMPGGPDPFWKQLAYQFDHVAWTGCSAWDLIQPSFMFIVGVAMPFSYAKRRARGDSWGGLFVHAVIRALILIVLGIYLQSQYARGTTIEFFNVLEQIGLGYIFVFLVLGLAPLWQLLIAVAILGADWLLFAQYPLPSSDVEWTSLGVPPDWVHPTGSLGHWDKNTNAAAAFDRWFLNLFPRADGSPFRFNEGGYTTLNFLPSIATMIFGVLAGRLLKSGVNRFGKVAILIAVGGACYAAGTAMDTTVCPIVKRIWTPSWVIYSTSFTCWLLAVFYLVIDVMGLKSWSFPLRVVGLNSIAMYVMAQSPLRNYIAKMFEVHLGPKVFAGTFGPIVRSATLLFVLWLICLWLYRKKIFFRI